MEPVDTKSSEQKSEDESESPAAATPGMDSETLKHWREAADASGRVCMLFV